MLIAAILASSLWAAKTDSVFDSAASASEAEAVAGLSAEDSAWIDAALDGGDADSFVRVRAVRLLDIDSSLQEFVEQLLPVKVGERLAESELERKLERHTREMSGRTDLFTSYRAIVAGFEHSGERVVVVEATSRYIGSYNGGDAFGYIGDHNRTLRGDQWGLWVGYNRNGFVWDSYLGKGWYVGLAGLFDFSVQDYAPDRGIARFRAGPRFRRILSPTWEAILDAGAWVALDPRGTRLGEEHRAVALVATPGLEWSQEWRKNANGVGWRLEASVPVGRDLSTRDVFAGPSASGILRTSDRSAVNSVILLNAAGVWNRPEFWATLTRALSYGNHGRKWSVDAAGTAEFQERWRMLRHQLMFTRCDLGTLVFTEGFLGLDGDAVRKGYSWGPGAWISFASPVGVDFVLQSGFDASGYQGSRFVTYAHF